MKGLKPDPLGTPYCAGSYPARDALRREAGTLVTTLPVRNVDQRVVAVTAVLRDEVDATARPINTHLDVQSVAAVSGSHRNDLPFTRVSDASLRHRSEEELGEAADNVRISDVKTSSHRIKRGHRIRPWSSKRI